MPIDNPGITKRPLLAMNGQHPCTVFYYDLRLPANSLVGEINQGRTVITSVLAQERILMGGFAAKRSLYLQNFATALHSTKRDGINLAVREDIRRRFAALFARAQAAARLLSLGATAISTIAATTAVEAAIFKVFSSRLEERIAEDAIEICSVEATFAANAPLAILKGQFEHSLLMRLMQVIGGGTNVIQRN